MESPFKGDVLKGKVALITGGGSGIGLEISTQFGKHGASIAIMGRRKTVLHSAVSTLQSLGIRVPFRFHWSLIVSLAYLTWVWLFLSMFEWYLGLFGCEEHSGNWFIAKWKLYPLIYEGKKVNSKYICGFHLILVSAHFV